MDSKRVFRLLRTTISESFYADSSPRYYFAIVESEAGPVLHFRPFISSRKNRLRISSQWYWIRWLWNLLATFVFIEFRCFSFVHFSERTPTLRCYSASPILFSSLPLRNFSDTFLSQMINVLNICKFRCSYESSDFASIKVLQLLYTFLTLQFAAKSSNSIAILVSRISLMKFRKFRMIHS